MNLGGRPRPVLALAAIGLLLLLGYFRVRAGLSKKKPQRTFDSYERALRIQEQREKKYWR
ncbi:MAG: hypothetical protein ABR508_03165 [Candidatus Baltobacteraceae bacterium]